MSGFAVLNQESKILKKKEKAEQRQIKIQERLEQVATTQPSVSNWADASDDEEDDKLFQPVSSPSDSEASEKSDDEEGKAPNWEDRTDAVETPARGKADAKVAPKSLAKEKEVKKKKEEKKDEKKKDAEEDLDALLGEFGVEINEDAAPTSAAAAKRKKKKDEKKAAEGEGEVADKKVEKGPAAEPEANGVQEEEAVDEEARQAALEALKKKRAAAGKKGGSSAGDAQKAAAAEAKKRAAANKNSKKDKSGYDR